MPTAQTGSVLERSVLKEGQIFLVADRGGDIKAFNLEGHGLYYRDMRHLSLFEMDITGARPTLLSSAGELNFMSTLQFTNDTLLGPTGDVIAEPRTISIRRNRFVHNGLHERLGLVNYNPHAVELTVRFTFGSDFRDMFEVRGYYADQGLNRELKPIQPESDGVLLAYRGDDGVDRHTRISFDPDPHHIEIVNDRLRRLGPTESLPGLGQRVDPREEALVVPPIAAAVFHVELQPMQARSITIEIVPEASDTPTLREPSPERANALDMAFVGIRDSYDEWRSNSTRIQTDHQLFDQLLNRALQDLRLLIDTVDGDLVPTAGIPWFAVPFGRDSLITAMQTLILRPAIAEGTLRFLARHQGTERNDFRDEAPGKILHEVRSGELARLRRVPHSPYYGSVDATPLFLIGLGEYITWSGDLDLARRLLPHAEAGLRWMSEYGDIDGDSFLEYHTRSSEGMRNQGWKDSADSATHQDGRVAEPPIALAEVQAYAFAAHREMARLYARLGMPDREQEQRGAAKRLRESFVSSFGMCDEDGPFWAMGLDGGKQPIETVTSNPGHALWCRLLDGEGARLTVARLMQDDMLCGWGVRTLSSRARSFNPMSYHNGSIWPHDNALIALGMKRTGHDAAALDVASQIFEAGLRFPGARLPELWCGFSRDRRYHSTPAQYPVSCSPQAWGAGSAFMLLQALLGLEADAFERVVRLRPLLPAWLGRVSLRKLRVCGTSIDVDVFREGHRTVVDVLEDGGLRIDIRQAEDG
ncbi:MAG: amylo-alpha-1,6-glucosidase [Chloroflexi bacterium]|nr:amylo-alpha-1,6-glucosidase [Chloroflexota bacterium]